jgi:3D-(3,5/4)-trihydroxycyclohexane-1,2-dione acylhydrolase (decyclizing)
VTLALPQDVQAEAYDFPEDLFSHRIWHIPRCNPDQFLFSQAIDAIRKSKRPMIIAGGGVLYSEASEALDKFARQTGIPVGETQAGKGSLRFDHPQNAGAVGATGTLAANRLARDADLIIGIGTRYSDFTTASKTAFQNPEARFININVAEFDSFKHSAIPLTGDARLTLEQLSDTLTEYKVDSEYHSQIAILKEKWTHEVDRLFHLDNQPLPAQSEVIGAIWDSAEPRDVLVSAAGSHPGDLHKLWGAHQPNTYHLEYGYSCMGYEIPGAIGVKMADPSREVYAFVGDGTYLMMPSEIVTAVQEGLKIIIVLVNNHGFSSIGGLSQSIGSAGFGTRFRMRNLNNGELDGEYLPVDFAANAHSLGAEAISVCTIEQFRQALQEARKAAKTTVIVVETDGEVRVPGYDSWWDVAVAETSTMDNVKKAREEYEKSLKKERHFL